DRHVLEATLDHQVEGDRAYETPGLDLLSFAQTDVCRRRFSHRLTTLSANLPSVQLSRAAHHRTGGGGQRRVDAYPVTVILDPTEDLQDRQRRRVRGRI